MGKEQIQPKKQSRLKNKDMPKEVVKKAREEKLKSQVRGKKQGSLTDLDFLTMSIYGGRVK